MAGQAEERATSRASIYDGDVGSGSREPAGGRYQSVLDKPFTTICEKAGIPKKLSSKCFRRRSTISRDRPV
jgi:hypothetical protein